jgi:MOSC domain-containing protein YiiM
VVSFAAGTGLLSLRVGGIAPLGPGAVPSAIGKQPVAGRMALTRLGLAGDDQADRRHHGGLDKALHHYPAQHYAAWRDELPERASLFEPGGFGENLSTLGLDEENVCLGDIFRLGSATIQVSQGRQPCWKLNLRFAVPDMARRVQEQGRAGWYYRVLEEGEVGSEDRLLPLERPHPDWPLARLLRIFYRDTLDRDGLAALAALAVLAPGWRDIAAKRLESGRVEDWRRRLEGRASDA